MDGVGEEKTKNNDYWSYFSDGDYRQKKKKKLQILFFTSPIVTTHNLSLSQTKNEERQREEKTIWLSSNVLSLSLEE